MSALRVARIPYLNSAPFYQKLEGAGYELVDMLPRELGRLAIDGCVDAGILSLCDLHRTEAFEPVGSFAITVDGPAHSVLLFTRGDPAALGGATISITGETSTSFPLLRLLLEQRLGVVPREYVRRPEGPRPDDAAVLLIGDAALRLAAAGGLVPGLADYSVGLIPLARPTAGEWTHVMDLGTAWQSWQGLPFVFARWAVGHHVSQEDRAELSDRLERSLAASLCELLPLATANCAAAGLDGESARAYLAGFGYECGPREKAGQGIFLGLLEATDWWEREALAAPVEVGS
jgi:chorismate dehydratase